MKFENLMTVEEIANYVGCHKNTVWAWIKSGKLPAYKIGPRMVRVYVDDLRWMMSDYSSSDIEQAS